MVGLDISTVSKHLSVLKNAGIVIDDKRGNQVFYQLRTPCILIFFGCVEAVMNGRPKQPTAPAEIVTQAFLAAFFVELLLGNIAK